jgi:hypothetical protein
VKLGPSQLWIDKRGGQEKKFSSNPNLMLGRVIVYPLTKHLDQIVQLHTDANLTRADDKLVISYFRSSERDFERSEGLLLCWSVRKWFC